MTVVRRVARPMLASVFVVGGLDAYRHPGGRVEKVAPLVHRFAPRLGLPDDPERLVRANGAAMVAAGTLLAAGRMPRTSALVLAGSQVPTTVAGHPFWQVQEPSARAAQRTQLLKNLGLLGGLLLAVVDTEGRPGLAWRAGRVARDVRRTADLTARTTAQDARRLARTARREARHAAATARRQARHTALAARREARLAAVTARDKLT